MAETTHPGPQPTAPAVGVPLLLTAGVLVGPLYVVTWLGQALVRDGFDLTRHPASILVNGPGGWVQVANFLVCGVLTVAAGVGLVRADPAQRGVGRAVGLYGLGLVAGGVFHADPADGFPPGTPETTGVSWHGLLHLVGGSIGFVGFVVAAVLAGRLSRRRGHVGWSRYSLVTGVGFLAAFVGIASGSGSRVTVVAFSVAVVAGWAWLSAWSGRTGADPRQDDGPPLASR